MAFEFLFDAPTSDHAVVIRNDDRTVWAYLHTPEGVVSDVWLFNLQTAPDEIETEPGRDRPPLNPARFCSSDARPVIQYADDLELLWEYNASGHLQAVEVLLKHERLARLAPGAKPGWSLFAALDGPCALSLIGE